MVTGTAVFFHECRVDVDDVDLCSVCQVIGYKDMVQHLGIALVRVRIAFFGRDFFDHIGQFLAF
ncbi:Uncharacterised protein [Mycobacteroides abscessus subsp. abscessus]|nr:Uncharacterised protein [Mycobacteroides abscessus subsp. abscessus]